MMMDIGEAVKTIGMPSDHMAVEGVKWIIRDSLGLDVDAPVETEKPIVSLGKDISRIDIADILFKAGAYDTRYLSDGHINDDGREFLREVGQWTTSCAIHFYSLARDSSVDIFSKLTPMDVCLMAKYKRGIAA